MAIYAECITFAAKFGKTAHAALPLKTTQEKIIKRKVMKALKVKRRWIILMTAMTQIAVAGLAVGEPSFECDWSVISAADVAWLITATIFVLMMTPGLSFFYGGMTPLPKNLFRPCRLSTYKKKRMSEEPAVAVLLVASLSCVQLVASVSPCSSRGCLPQPELRHQTNCVISSLLEIVCACRGLPILTVDQFRSN